MAFVSGVSSAGRASARVPAACSQAAGRAARVRMAAETVGDKVEDKVEDTNPKSPLDAPGLFDEDMLGGEIFSSSSSSFLTTEMKPIPMPDFDDVKVTVSEEELVSRAEKYRNRLVETRNKFKRSDNDTGSAEYQIAQLTVKIAQLTEHLNEHPKDYSSRRGLQKMVEKRKKLFRYLYSEDVSRVSSIISALGIRFNLENLAVKNRYGNK
mmetsp:Transcript_11560/g.35344  ORF Transcript_11560/g.35344 Transcript_11560/m.35344 type:complete len:210 (-) Transcript_11560:133-762(-)